VERVSLNHQEFLRYSRQMMVEDMGEDAQERLKNSTAVIVGLGGLGCPASLYLAAAGFGKLILIDGDEIELSNLQRQILFRESDVGSLKAKVASKRLSKLNPKVAFDVLLENVDRQDLVGLVDEAAVILDCTDNMETRQEINRTAVAYNKPLISAAAMGWEGQLLEIRTDIDGAACLACAYGLEDAEPLLNCSTAGVMGPVLGVMGSMQAIRAIQIAAGNSAIAESGISRFDGKSGSWTNFGLPSKADCPVCS
jgi:sulfur carrier protein ThiS adenylyltransferase